MNICTEAKMAWWQILVVSAAFFAASASAKNQRIINGEDGKIEEFPYQASFRRGNAHFCGASIISEMHIITAGHCIHGDMVPPYSNYRVATGTSTRRSQGNLHRIASIKVHPDFWTDRNSAVNDIAIITLKDAIVFDEYQQKINLPEYNFKVGDKANITGWGLVNQIPPVRPNQLQKMEAEIISKEACQSQLKNPGQIRILDTEVCTIRKRSSGVCSGDSGGPLAINGELVGIVSWSDGDYCATRHPDVFTNVYKFKDFISSIVN